MTNIDKTAQEILELDASSHFLTDGTNEPTFLIEHIRSMAKLWLMRDEIVDHLTPLVMSSDPYDCEDEQVLLKKLEALEAE